LLATPLLLALEPRGDGLSFHPAKDSSLTKATEITMSFELGALSIVVDGTAVSGQIPADGSGNMEMSMTWTDKYVDLEKDGKPLDLIRSYDEMKGNMDFSGNGESNSMDIPEFDALSGKSLRFDWNKDKESYE